jgi:hypothetical protein
MIWQVLGLDLNRSESTGTLARAIPWGRLNVVEKEKLRLDVSVGDGTAGKVQLFSRINPGPIKAWRLRLGHLLPRRRGVARFSFPPLCSAWLGLRIFKRFSDRQFELALKPAAHRVRRRTHRLKVPKV